MGVVADLTACSSLFERWARVRGWWETFEQAACCCYVNVSGEVYVEIPGQAGYWTISLPVAIAWALVVESSPEPVDVGRCLACVTRGGPMEWRKVPPGESLGGWITMGGWQRGADDYLYSAATRPCPACSSTGRKLVPLARAVLDSAPRTYSAEERALLFGHNPPPTVALGGCGDVVPTDRRVNVGLRNTLHVHADALAAAGHPAAMPLAWALRWSDEDGDTSGLDVACMLLHWITEAEIEKLNLAINSSIDRALRGHSLPFTAEGISNIASALRERGQP